jgi:hypothetical protein
MEKQSSQKTLVVGAIVAVFAIGGTVGYFYGIQQGSTEDTTASYDAGYTQAEADIASLQAETGKKATEQAAKEANPFGSENPLENVEANPFEKVKKVLNPFEEE